LTVQSFAGGGFGELRPDAPGASLIADGAMMLGVFDVVELESES
jgi:hypothetical protein